MTTIDQRIDLILKAGGERITTLRGDCYGTPDFSVPVKMIADEDEDQFQAFLKVIERRVARKKASK